MPNEPVSLEEYEASSGHTPMPFRIMLIPRHDRIQALLEEEREVTLTKVWMTGKKAFCAVRGYLALPIFVNVHWYWAHTLIGFTEVSFCLVIP